MPIKVTPLPELSYLRECFDYSILTGDLWWKVRPREHFKNIAAWKSSNTRFVGKKAGNMQGGYLIVMINGISYKAHRLLYKLIMECDPPKYIDHIDGKRDNNAWQNLREATIGDNSRNRKKPITSSTGFKGVSFKKDNGIYAARISFNNQAIHIGYFDTPEEAYAAYCEAALKYHGEFANLGE